jgi:hypothetical protein
MIDKHFLRSGNALRKIAKPYNMIIFESETNDGFLELALVLVELT